MADYDTIMRALRNAHAAGDANAAQRLAKMATEAKGAAQGGGFIDGLNSALESASDTLGAFNRSVAKVFTGGLSDEIGAAGGALLSPKSYDESLADARGQLERDQQNHPVLSTVGQVAGAITSPAATAAAKLINPAASIGRQMVQGAAAGGIVGAAQGFGEGEGAADRLKGFVGGGIFGAGAGGIAPAVAQGVQSVARNVADWRTQRALTGQLAGDLGVSRQAATHIADAVGADDATLMAQNIRRAGPDGMLADAGPAVQGALDAAMQRPGAAARQGMQAIEGRAAASMQRINDALDNALGAPAGMATTQGAIRGETAAARSAAYDAAYSKPIPYGLDLGGGNQIGDLTQAVTQNRAAMRLSDELLPRVPGKAIRDANLLMQLDGDTSRQIMAQIGDDGSVVFQQMPDVRQWDYIKRALDHAASSGDGQGALGGQTAMGRAYQGLSRQIRDTLKQAVPEYGLALDTSADAIRRVQGVETGYSMLRTGTTREGVKDTLAGVTGPEKEAIKQGVRDYLDDTLANVRAAITNPNTDTREAAKALGEMTSRASREKLQLLLGKDADPLFKALDEAQQSLGLRAAVAQNSKTAARQAYNERTKDLSSGGVMRNVMTAKPVQAVRRGAEALMGVSPEALARNADRVNAEVVGAFTRPGQQNALAQLETVLGRIEQNPTNFLAGIGPRNAVNAGGVGLAAPAANALFGLFGQ